MERNFYSDDDFEQLIKEKTEQYKMYPSEKVWKGVHSSLHTKKRWFIGGMSILITGIILFAGRELLMPERHGSPAKKIAQAVNTPAAGKTPAENTSLPAAFSEYKGGSRSASSPGSRNSQFSARPDTFGQTSSLIAIVETSDTVVNSPALNLSKDISAQEMEGHAPALTLSTTLNAIAAGANTGSLTGHEGAIARESANSRESGAAEENVNSSGSKPVNSKEENIIGARGQGRNSPVKRTGHAGTTGLAETNSGAGAELSTDVLKGMAATTGGSSGNNLSEMTTDQQRINWLQDYAVYNLRPSVKKGRKAFQFYLSPTVNYRSLSGGNDMVTKSNTQSVPYSNIQSGNARDYVNHIPALGLEAGGSFLYRATRNLTLKVGLQFNYSRYQIRAYSADSLQHAAIRTVGGNKQVTLNNEYYQLSLPVGFELRVMGNERLQLNIAAGIQPTYLLNRNAYLLTPDYTSYSQSPSQFRRLNFNGEAEIFLSYQMRGGIRWQVGPQFRYQFLSSYSSDYSIREHLKGYGLKIGITKTIR